MINILIWWFIIQFSATWLYSFDVDFVKLHTLAHLFMKKHAPISDFKESACDYTRIDWIIYNNIAHESNNIFKSKYLAKK